MVEFINKYTGGVMYVDEPRVAKYEALGHLRAGVVIADVVAVEVKDAIEEKPKTQTKKPSRGKKDPKEW